MDNKTIQQSTKITVKRCNKTATDLRKIVQDSDKTSDEKIKVLLQTVANQSVQIKELSNQVAYLCNQINKQKTTIKNPLEGLF